MSDDQVAMLRSFARADLATILAHLPASVTITSEKDGEVLLANSRAADLFGYTVDEFIGLTAAERGTAVDPAERDQLRAGLMADQPVERTAQLRHRDGTLRLALVMMRRVTLDGEHCVLSMARDVNDQTAAEGALREVDDRFRQMAEAVDEGFILATLEPPAVVFANPAVEQIFGRPRADFYANPQDLAEILVHPDDLHLVLPLRADFKVEHRIVRPDGAVRWVVTRATPVGTDAQQRVALTVQDITERKESELAAAAAWRQAEAASQAKSELLSRVSHELRTPLNAILGFGQLLELEEPTDDQRSSIEQILRAGRHLLGLVNGVLDITRVETGWMSMSLEAVSVSAVVAEALDEAQPNATRLGITLTDLTVATERLVRADRQRLGQALGHLIANAVGYNRPGGTVDVGCETTGDGRSRLVVRDSGPGIAEHLQATLFLPFEHSGGPDRSTTGSGLGLPLARSLVEAMGGTLGMRSAPDRGSTFWIELPNATLGSDDAMLAQTRVLYIEDNEANARLVERVASRLPDVELELAARGEDGLRSALARPPDLVLLDLHLPGVGGEAVLTALRADPITRSTRVVVVSADASPETLARVRALGADDFLAKPYALPALIEVLRSGSTMLPTPGPVDDGVLDIPMLKALADLDEGDESGESVADLVELFLAQSAKRIDELAAEVERGDAEQVWRVAHTLKGSSANFGAAHIAVLSERICASAHAGDLNTVSGELPVLREAMATAAHALRAWWALPHSG